MFSSQRAKRFKTAGLLLGLGLGAALAFSWLRARRLLFQTRQMAAHSEQFSCDYWVGNGPQLTYLSMGDSAAAGWGAENLESTIPHQIAQSLAARGFLVHVVNVAVGGATLAQVREKQSHFLHSTRPDLITLLVGANDATHGTSGADFGREMQLMLSGLQLSSARLILVANTPDMLFAPALPTPLAQICGRRARALNTILSGEIATTQTRTRIIDIFGRGKLDYSRDPGLFAADLFHPSGRGYAVWAQLFAEEVQNRASDSPLGQTQPR